MTSVTLTANDESVTMPLDRFTRGVTEITGRALAPIPADSQFIFAGSDFLPAPDLDDLAEDLIYHEPPFEFLRDTWGSSIVYRWKRKGGTSAGAAVLGKCVALSGAARHFAGKRYLIWLGADTCREARLTAEQLRALVYHELCHLTPGEIDDTGEETPPTVVGHDVEAFTAEIRRFGLWRRDLAQAKAAFDDLPLFAARQEA